MAVVECLALQVLNGLSDDDIVQIEPIISRILSVERFCVCDHLPGGLSSGAPTGPDDAPTCAPCGHPIMRIKDDPLELLISHARERLHVATVELHLVKGLERRRQAMSELGHGARTARHT